MEYIIVNDIKDGQRYIRKLTKENKYIINTKTITLDELVKEVIIQDYAKKDCLEPIKIIDRNEASSLLMDLLEDKAKEGYFIPKVSLSKQTAVEVLNNLFMLRMAKTTDIFNSSKELKIKQIRELIKEYEDKLEDLKYFDKVRLYKTAINLLNNNTYNKDHYSIDINHYHRLSYLEKTFLELYTNNQYTVLSLTKDKTKEEYLKDTVLFKGYGIPNEIEYLINDIMKHKYPLGDIIVYYTNTIYESYIEALFNSRGISYSMTSRQIAPDNEYFRVLKAILNWANNNYNYKDLKEVMIKSPILNKQFYKAIKDNICWGIENYKPVIELKEDSLFYGILDKLVNVFTSEDDLISLDKVFLDLISITRDIAGDLEEYQYASPAFNKLSKYLSIYKKQTDMKEVIRILNEEVSLLTYTDHETSSSITVSKLDSNADILERSHVYILGMSSNHYSPSAKESPVLSDDERLLYMDHHMGYLRQSRNMEQEKNEALYNTLMSRDINGTLAISYAYYDTVELIDRTPCIPYLRIMESIGINDKDIESIGYQNIIQNNVIYKESNLWSADEETIHKEIPVIKSWSTTSLQELLACPLKFYYHHILHLPQEDYKDAKPDQWLAANEKGTFAHAILEDYCNEIFLGKKNTEITSDIHEELFDNIFNKQLEIVKQNIPIVSNAVYELELDEIKETCRNYICDMHKEFSDLNNPWIVYACELAFNDIPITFKYEDKDITLNFKGFIDRLDYYIDNDGVYHYRVIDYKSGRTSNNKGKIDTNKTVQHIVYTHAVKYMNKDVNNNVECAKYVHFFDDNEKEIILDSLKIHEFPQEVHRQVIDALIDGNSGCLKDDCKYCKYKDICKG